MIALHPKFIVDESQEKQSVVLPFKEWLKVLEQIEQLEEIRAYDKAKADTEDEILPFDQVVSELHKGELHRFTGLKSVKKRQRRYIECRRKTVIKS